MKKARKTIIVLAVAGIILAFGNIKPVSAEIAKNFGDKGCTVSLYGQVNRAVLYADDGESDDYYYVDNDFSSSRIGAKAKIAPDNRLAVGAHFEVEYQSNASNKVGQGLSNTAGDKFDERIIEAYISGKFGKLSLGQGKTASDETSEIDLSGTKVIGSSKVQAFAGGIRFFDNSTGVLSGVKTTNTFNNLDGMGLADRIRYDSPKYLGFQLSLSTVSADGGDGEDIAMRYAGKISDVKVQAAISFVNYSSSSANKNQTSGSLSMLLPNGINFTVAAGNRDMESPKRDDPTFYYAKLGYITEIISFGSTAFSLDWGNYKNISQNHDDGGTLGIMCVQTLKRWNSELYFGYRNYQLDRIAVDLEDINAAMAGLRVKF